MSMTSAQGANTARSRQDAPEMWRQLGGYGGNLTERSSMFSNTVPTGLRMLNDPMLASQQLMDLTQQIEVMKKQIELQKLQNQMLEMRQSAMMAQSQMPVQ